MSAYSKRTIAVIGAGVAGLAAAQYFRRHGVDAVVLEARGKPGGRLKTNSSLGFPFDEGASWIHGAKGNPITSLAKQAGAETYLTDDDKVAVFDVDGTRYSDTALDTEEERFDRALSELDGALNVSFEEAFYRQFPELRSDRLWTYMLSAYLEFDTGADLTRLSSLDFADDDAFPGDDVIVTNGFNTVTKYLSRDLDIRLNERVSAIDYCSEKVLVHSSTEILAADYVLLTVPLGVLKKGVISFDPPLPNQMQRAIGGLAMGSVNKFLCLWEEVFWDDTLQYIGLTTQTRGTFNYFLNMSKFSDVKALMGFSFGEYSIRTETMTDDAVVDAFTSNLKAALGVDIPDPHALLRTRWNTDDCSFGAYSFVPNETRSTLFEVFEQPIDSKVFFAGEHTSRAFRGTVHGAYLSGLREAERLASLL